MRLLRRCVVGFLVITMVLTAAGPAAATPRYRRGIDISFPTSATARYGNDYGAARSGGRRHAAIDLFARRGAPVYAARAGRVLWLPTVEQFSAGFALWIRDRRGRTFAYYHLGPAGGRLRQAVAPGLRYGTWVRRGQRIGWVGDSGNAAGGSPHLHFEIHDPRVRDPFGYHRRNPYQSLRRAQGLGVPVSRSARRTPVATGTASLRMGSRGPAVARWQRRLNRVSRARLAVDGAFGPATHAATVRFQRSAGLGPSGLGTVGPRTRAAMKRRLRSRSQARATPVATAGTMLRLGSRGPAVARWQRRLNRATRARLAVDGAFGPATHAATVRFQQSAGLGPSGLGIVGPLTRRAMARRLR